MASRISTLPAPAASEQSPRLLATAEDWRALNDLYLNLVARRALGPPEDAVAWMDRQVIVFLRHDNHDVFCVHGGDTMLMANWVRLRAPHLMVDEAGRQQTLRNEGPLPNQRSIHAVLTGRLAECYAKPRQLPSHSWRGVRYHPLHDSQFVDVASGVAVVSAREAILAPGRVKVWVR